jgi:hypothetical protein
MEQKLCVLLYSKYSQHCQRLTGMINSCGFDFYDGVGMSTLCIDNEDIRAKIQTSNNIEIQTVPCILSVFVDGSVEKFEGDSVFAWVEEKIHRMAPARQQERQPAYVHFNEPEPVHDEVEEEIEEEIEEKPRPRVVRKPKPAPKLIKAKASTKKKYRDNEHVEEITEEGSTNIDDLSDEDQEDSVPIKRPPNAVRTGPGSYDISEVGEPDMTEQKVPEDALSKKRGVLMASAKEMQMLRDEQDENSRPAGMPKQKS